MGLVAEGTKLRASIFYPSGGLLETGIWSTARNRPADLARERESTPVPTIEEFKQAAKAAGMDLQFQDLDDLAQVALQGIREEQRTRLLRASGFSPLSWFLLRIGALCYRDKL